MSQEKLELMRFDFATKPIKGNFSKPNEFRGDTPPFEAEIIGVDLYINMENTDEVVFGDIIFRYPDTGELCTANHAKKGYYISCEAVAHCHGTDIDKVHPLTRKRAAKWFAKNLCAFKALQDMSLRTAKIYSITPYLQP